MPRVDGDPYFAKLTEVIEVEYFVRTKYVMFKCNCANSMRDKGYKVDEYGLIFVNFKNLVHTREMITNKPYVLMLQVDQVFYVVDERDWDWACVVKTKPKNIYDVGQGEGLHDTCDNHHECEPLILTSSDYHNPHNDVDYRLRSNPSVCDFKK